MRKAVIFNPKPNNRIELGISYLISALENIGYDVVKKELPENYSEYKEIDGDKFFIGCKDSNFIKWLEENDLLIYHSGRPGKEGFYIQSCPGRLYVASAFDETGALYGCLHLSERIQKNGELPYEIAYGESPEFKLRGPAIGLQKTKIEPPRLTYEYPITPDRFPWFYDKEHWLEFLDMMLENRCNVLYIWSGHPFSSLVRLKEYPEALEVTEEEFKLNKEMFTFLTNECDKRGIWVVLKFYNIHIPYPFAQKHDLPLLQSNINPLVADYTAKSIVEFIKSFPNIGLMVCLGEALRGTQNKTDWFVETIIPAIKEGIKQAGLNAEPPVILRGHDCDPFAAMEGAMKQYSNLYTMWKYNGEGLTTYLPRGNWMERHKALSEIGTTHIMNVHIVANLEPFRFEAPNFIQKCVQAGQNLLGVNGLHLYPLFYWDWPYSPDRTDKRLKQIDRDYIWYKAWFRYAFNPDRDEQQEREYWINVFSEYYKCSREDGENILEAMECAGQIAPKILGRIGITEGNRQTLSLGMTMDQLTNAIKSRPNFELYNSVARQGEQLDTFVKNEVSNKGHLGETPLDMLQDIKYYADRAIEKADRIKDRDNPEIARIIMDVKAIKLLQECFNDKVLAAVEILTYKNTMDDKCFGDLTLLDNAQSLMESSLKSYSDLASLTEKTYLYANSMQTRQRKIPFPDGEKYGHWTACLPEYQKELDNFRENLKLLKKGQSPVTSQPKFDIKPLKGISFKVLSEDCETYKLEKGSRIFTDSNSQVQMIAPEIDGLTGVRFGMGKAITEGATVKLELEQDSKVLIGYMNSKGIEWLQLPELETNTHADDRGGLTVVYENALKDESCPAVNIHAYRYEKGTHEIYMGTGAFIIAGVVSDDTELVKRNAGLNRESFETLDWLYENGGF